MICESLSPTPRQRATYRQAFCSRASSVRVVAPVSPQLRPRYAAIGGRSPLLE